MKSFRVLAISVAMLISASAYSQIGLKAIGAGVGIMGASVSTGTNSEGMTGIAFGAGVDLGEITPGLHLFPDVGYWSASKSINTGAGSFDFSTSDFVINANVQYVFGGSQIMPYVGGGLGINFLGTSTPAQSFGSGPFTVTIPASSASATRLGINLMGGVAYPLNNQMAIGAQFRYVIASDFNHWLALATFRYNLTSM